MLKVLQEDKKETSKEKKRLKNVNKRLLAQVLKFGVFKRKHDLSVQQLDLKSFFFQLWR